LNELVWNQLAQDLTRLWDVLTEDAQEVLSPVGQRAFNPFEVERVTCPLGWVVKKEETGLAGSAFF